MTNYLSYKMLMYRIPFYFVAALGILTMSTFLGDTIFDWEEYRLIDLLESQKPLPSNITVMHFFSLELPFKFCRYWWGDNAIGWRMLSIPTGIITILCMCRFSKVFFVEPGFQLFFFAGLSLNWFLCEYARWGLFTYVASITYAFALILVYWHISEQPSSWPLRITTFLLSLIGLFIALRNSVLVCMTGPPTVLLVHIIYHRNQTKSFFMKCKDMLWLSGFLLPLVLFFLSALPAWLDPSLRGPDAPTLYRSNLYYQLAEKGHGLYGFLHFFYFQTKSLLYSVLHPLGVEYGLWGSVLSALVILGLIGSLWPKNVNPTRSFFSILTIISLTEMIILNSLTLYPYGDGRYASFLILPAMFLATCGLMDLLCILGYFIRSLTPQRLEAVLILSICIAACFVFSSETKRHFRDSTDAQKILTTMRSDADLFLVEARYARIFKINAPNNVDKMITISGPAGTKLAPEPDPELLERLSSKQDKNIVTIWRQPWFGRKELAPLFESNFHETSSAILFKEIEYIKFFNKYTICIKRFQR